MALRILGVIISSRLTMGEHLDQLISSCASSIFALRTLRAHGLQPPQLHHVARATTVASLLYDSLAWWCFASAEDRSRLERLLGRLKRGSYLPDDFPTAESPWLEPQIKSCLSPSPATRIMSWDDTTMRKSPLVTTCAPGIITFYSLKRTIETLSPDPYMLNSKLRIVLFYFNFFNVSLCNIVHRVVFCKPPLRL